MAEKICPAQPGRSGTPRIVTLAWLRSRLTPRTTTSSMLGVASLALVPGLVLQAGPNFEADAKFFRELDRARLHHLGTGARHFEQFVVGDLVDLARIRQRRADRRCGRRPRR